MKRGGLSVVFIFAALWGLVPALPVSGDVIITADPTQPDITHNTQNGILRITSGLLELVNANNAIRIGNAATVTYLVQSGISSITIGGGASGPTFARGDNSIAIGSRALALTADNIAIGTMAQARETDVIAIGKNAGTNVTGGHNIFLGPDTGAASLGSWNTVMGWNAGMIALGDGNVAVGGSAGSYIIGEMNTAVGYGAGTGETGKRIDISRTVALGSESKTLKDMAIAVGANSQAAGLRSISIGGSETLAGATGADGNDSIAMGATAQSRGLESIAIGKGAQTLTAANSAVAVGLEAKAAGPQSIAIGQTSKANADTALAIGPWAEATGEQSIAMGESSKAGALNAMALGDVSQATHQNALAIGMGTKAFNEQAVAIGSMARTEGIDGIAMGSSAQALGDRSIAIGTGNVVTGARSGAFGDPNIINGADSYSVGNNNRIGSTTNNAFALGNNVYLGADANGVDTVNVSGAVALGNASSVTVQNGVALGSTSVADRSANLPGYVPAGADGAAIAATTKGTLGSVSVGTSAATRQIINVAAGSADSDAVNVAQLKAVTSAVGASGLDFTANDATPGVVHRDLGTTLAIKGGATTGGTYSGANLRTVTDPVNGAILMQMADAPVFTGAVTAPTFVTSGTNAVTMSGATGTIAGLTNRTLTDPTFGTVGRAATEEQLSQIVIAAGQGWNLSANGDNATHVMPGAGKVTLQQGANITVTRDGTDPNKLVIATTPNLSATSFTTGNTRIDTTGLAIAGGPSVTNAGISAGHAVITNVAAGTKDTDAVNLSQLKTATVGTGKVTAGKNITIISPVPGTSVVSMADAPVFPGQVTANGFDANNTRIVNVAPGAVSATSTDGVNGSQLYNTAASTATHLGGGAKVNADGTVSAPTYNVGGGTYHTVGDALSAVSGGVGSELNELRGDIAGAGASSAALAGLHSMQYDPMAPSQFMLSAGNYRGEWAFALGVSHYPSENFLLHAGVALGGGDHAMANFGATWKIGSGRSKDEIPERYRKGPISSVYVMQQENIQLQSQVQMLTTENAGIRTENTEIKAQNTAIMEENAEIKAQLAAIMKKLGMK